MTIAKLTALVEVVGARLAQSELDGMAKKVNNVSSAADKMAMAIGTAGAAAGAYSLGRSALDAAARMEALQMALKSNTSGTQELQAVTKDLAAIAKLPAINLEQAYLGFIQLKAAKLSTKEAEDGLRGVAKAAAAVAATPDQFGRAINGLQQIANSTKPLQEDINILRDSLPNAVQLLDKAFGKSRAEDIAAMGLSGREVAMRFIQIANTVPAVEGGIGNMIVNMEDAFRQLNESIGRLAAKFLEAFGPRVQEVVGKLTDLFDRLSKNGDAVDKIMRVAFTFMVGSVVAGAIKNVAAITEAFIVLRKAIQSVAVAEAMAVAIASPGKAIAAIGAALAIGAGATFAINKMFDSMFGKGGGGEKAGPVQINIPPAVQPFTAGGSAGAVGAVGTGQMNTFSALQEKPGPGASRGGRLIHTLAQLVANLALIPDPRNPKSNNPLGILGKIEQNTKATADVLQLRRQTLGGGPIGAYGVTAAELSGQANLRFGDFSASSLIPAGTDLERSMRRIIRDESRKTGLPGNIRRF